MLEYNIQLILGLYTTLSAHSNSFEEIFFVENSYILFTPE